MKTKFIEFIGNPSSGKSTIVEDLTSTLRGDGFKVLNLSYEIARMGRKRKILHKLLYYIKFTLIHPAKIIYIFAVLINSRQNSLKDFVKVYFNFIFVLSLYTNRRNYDYDYVFYDQGFYQAIWSILIEANTKVNIENLYTRLNEIPYLVYLDVDRSEVERRLKLRETNLSRFEQNEDIEDALNRSYTILETIFSTYNSNEKIKLSNNLQNDFTENIDRLLNFIKSYD
ncbi:MAG: hypothetical protein B6229_00545 [Spirochaetaceae bacterium 4572_7]|nr:MAG: hypothetical protein B6229_00545 [Spirochaetaceae bacterium 4572_7]